ncbi:uncharacterized protein MONOS_16168 [Monocercomonoides exilis]|uniref:uncharacterized protein n=1 Tax=Monocercomonoides exilis TaxID=2049356 RepID=UPI003559A339|nr:hypothetical protein MONOS_16168 [Monocercomonoides exilis]|eukprot:MONOS_16168.1-p1 / transcript=MONOS_16168.1 / gene=MONOS_16168 / organism=Monocercomonoides_exilis_PA203 / gene_product=unspecified product / transcript_product=unspecified product / location=Mono_scaffold01536:1184-4218(-) / protein_length=957 / sequence_SO=supercontig / SO=protein_coding / is_pseudo=false
MFQGTEHPPLLPQPSALSQLGADTQGGSAQAGTLKASPTGNSKSTASIGASRISRKEGGQHKSSHRTPQHQLGEWPRSQFPSPQLPRGYREDQQQGQPLDRANVPRKSEWEGGCTSPRDRNKRNAIEFRESDNATGNLTQSRDGYDNGTRGRLREYRRGIEPTKQKNEQKSEKEEEKGALRASGTIIESPIGIALEVSSKTAIADTLEGEVNTQMRFGHKMPGERERIVIGPPKEPLPGRLVNRQSKWKEIGRDKQVCRGVSGDDGDEEQLFIPLAGGTDRLSGEAHTEVGGEVVQPNIHGDKEKRKVEKDQGLQGAQRGSAGKAFQDGFPGDSGGTPEGERLDDHSGHIGCIPTCQGGRAIQSLPVLQLSEAMPFLRRDAFWSARCAQRIHKDNDTSSVLYQREVNSEARNTLERYFPHASRQGCVKIDLAGDSPVPVESGLDTVGREIELVINKECGVPWIALELGKDGNDAPREEESAAPGGCANLDSTGKEEEETKDERLSSTPREVEFCEVTTPTSELVDEAHAIHTEAGNSPRRLEGNGDSQPNDTGRINTLEKDTTGKQTKESEEKEQTSGTNDGRFRAGMGCSANNTEREQRGEDICPRKLDHPGERVCDKREGVQSSVEDFRKERSMAERTEDRSYLVEYRQHVHEMDNTEEEGRTISHSNTESIREEIEQPGHKNTNRKYPGSTKHGSRCTQPDGERTGQCTEVGESRRDIANSRTENTRYYLRTDCTSTMRKNLETIFSEKGEIERNTKRRDSASPSVPENHWTGAEREDERSSEGTDDSDSASLAGADLDPATAAWAFDKDPGDFSGVHDSGSEDEKGRLETTPRGGDIRHTGEENIPGRCLFLTWGEYVGAKNIAAAILKNQKSERDTWRALRRIKQFFDRESMNDTDTLTSRDAKWIMAELTETQSSSNLSRGVIYQTVRKVLDKINLFREIKIDGKDIEIF